MDYCSVRVAVDSLNPVYLFRFLLRISNKMISETGSPVFLTASRYKIYITSFLFFIFYFTYFRLFSLFLFTNRRFVPSQTVTRRDSRRANPQSLHPPTIESFTLSRISRVSAISLAFFFLSITRNTDTGHTRSVKVYFATAHIITDTA